MGDAAVEHLPVPLSWRGAGGHQQRPEMLAARVGARGMRCIGQRSAQALIVAGRDGIAQQWSG